MRKRQPSRLAAVLAGLLTAVCTVAKLLERRAGTSELVLYLLLGLAIALAAAYLISLYQVKKGRGGVPGKESGTTNREKTLPGAAETDKARSKNTEVSHG